jgi:hypothetical protein
MARRLELVRGGVQLWCTPGRVWALTPHGQFLLASAGVQPLPRHHFSLCLADLPPRFSAWPPFPGGPASASP